MDSNEDLDNFYRADDDDDYSLSSAGSLGKSGKRSKSKSKANKLFYLKVLITLLVVEAYYAYNYSSVREYTSTTQVQVSELNLTTNMEPFFWFAFNT